jgi:hypothetical protein
MVTAGFGFVASVRKRFGQLKDLGERGGQQGPFFFATYTVFQYAYGPALVLWGVLGLAVLVGGIAEIANSPVGLPYVTPLFDEYAFQILAIAILLFVVAALNVLSWIPISLLGWIPGRCLPLKQSPGWYNLRQFSFPLGDPKPLFINPGGISSLADAAISKLEGDISSDENFAATPVNLSLDERANAALLGCLLEKEHGIRKWQKPRWQTFYSAVASAETGGKRLVSPDYLRSQSTNVDFYGVLTREVNNKLPQNEPRVPDSAEARHDLSNAVRILVKKYKGSARNLAFTWWRRHPSLRVAFNRSQAFYPLDAASMIPQFLKLAVRWETWSAIQPGNFIYPYARNLALLLFEKHAIVTLPDVKKMAFRDAGELAVYRETMHRTVIRIRDILSTSAKPQHHEILARYGTEWQLAAAVDFALWSYSAEMTKAHSFDEWKLDENGFVSRKEDSKSSSTQSEGSSPKEI